MLHFAYGSNMNMNLMRRFAPNAQPLGVAQLTGHRFVITADGYASVAPLPGAAVHGVLWRLTARDCVALDGWENVAAGLYRVEWLPVRAMTGRASALVYVARAAPRGRPKPGYMELVRAAACEWNLPQDYCEQLERFTPASWRAGTAPLQGPAAKFGDLG